MWYAQGYLLPDVVPVFYMLLYSCEASEDEGWGKSDMAVRRGDLGGSFDGGQRDPDGDG